MSCALNSASTRALLPADMRLSAATLPPYCNRACARAITSPGSTRVPFSPVTTSGMAPTVVLMMALPAAIPSRMAMGRPSW